jgi:YD repeat-containing protein
MCGKSFSIALALVRPLSRDISFLLFPSLLRFAHFLARVELADQISKDDCAVAADSRSHDGVPKKLLAPVVATGCILFHMANDEGETERNNVTYTWSVFGNIIAVTAPDGRSKRTHLGGVTPASMAKILARELDAETPKKVKKYF